MMTKSLLSSKAVMQHMEWGSVVIRPFTAKHLNTSSYDVTLGENYFRESPPADKTRPSVFVPHHPDSVADIWGQPHKAKVVKDIIQQYPELKVLDPDAQVIMVAPGETILCHTQEFIGGRDTVTTMMKARSSMGRCFIEVCKCAGWGDIGYINRWTMEVTNNSRYHTIPLLVGSRVAQIVFFDSDGAAGGDSYERGGKYQTTSDINDTIVNWQPECMLPKLYLDLEPK